MVRYVIDDDPHIEIAYGSDHGTGLFLSVYDRRLGWCQGASDDVNAVSRKVGCGDGEGGYFDLHTGIGGFGQRVSESTIITYMYRYGASKKQIAELLSSEELLQSRNLDKSVKEMDINKGEHDKSEMMAPPPVSSTVTPPISPVPVAATACTHCGQTASQRCARCQKNNGQKLFYCSKKCQQADWSSHKHFCSLIIPEKINNDYFGKWEKSVLAVLLPENNPKPSFVEIPLKPKAGHWVPKLLLNDNHPSAIAIFGKPYKGLGHNSKNWNAKANRLMKNMLHFVYRDAFLEFADGSQPNKCVYKMLNGAVPKTWKGPILVLKTEGIAAGDSDYLDMQLADADDIVDFFRTYGSSDQ